VTDTWSDARSSARFSRNVEGTDPAGAVALPQTPSSVAGKVDEGAAARTPTESRGLALLVDRLTKRFGDRTAFADLSLPRGSDSRCPGSGESQRKSR
jgi:hypothetical protein